MLNYLVYQTLEDINGTGFIGIFQTAAAAFDNFAIKLPELILAAIFLVLAFTSFYSTERRKGRGDLPASFAVAGLVCVVVSILMSMIPNFISTRDIIIAIILEIIFVFWQMTSRE